MTFMIVLLAWDRDLPGLDGSCASKVETRPPLLGLCKVDVENLWENMVV